MGVSIASESSIPPTSSNASIWGSEAALEAEAALQYWEEPACGSSRGSGIEGWAFSRDPAPAPPIRVLPDVSTRLLVGRDVGGEHWTIALCGATDAAQVVQQGAARDQIEVRLAPGTAAGWWALPATEFAGREIRLQEVADESFVDSVEAALAGAPDPAGWRQALERSLPAQGFELGEDGHLAQRALGRWARELRIGSVSSVEGLCAGLGVGRRRMERAFARAVGLSPKRALRVLRFRAARAGLARGDDASRVALACGYADQAHLSRECRALGGATATELRGSLVLRS